MGFSLYIPNSLAEAVELKRSVGGRYLAAGTVLLAGERNYGSLISLGKIPELQGIRELEDGIEVGASVTFGEICKSDAIRDNLRALWRAARAMGNPQIRNRATIGGNVASFMPGADAVPALLAADAEYVVFNGTEFRSLKCEGVSGFDPDDILVSVKFRKGFRSAFEKIGKRNASAVSILSMAVAVRGDKVRVAMGSVAEHAVFCENTSELLSGYIGNIDEAGKMLMAEINPRDDRWGTRDYKLKVARNLLGKLVGEVSE